MGRSLTAQEAAAELGYHKDYLYRLLNQGTVKGERVGHVWLISRQEVDRIKSLQSEKGRLPKSARK